MKGIIFRQFLELVELKFGEELADTIINESNLPNDGAYTAVGTYNHKELIRLLGNLSKHTKIEQDALLKEFGINVFSVFTKAYKTMFDGMPDGFTFLSKVEDTIHVEVLKLYPEAELPSILVNEISDKKMVLTYHSMRSMGDFAEGLILGCMNHFNENVELKKKIMANDGSQVRFTLTRK